MTLMPALAVLAMFTATPESLTPDGASVSAAMVAGQPAFQEMDRRKKRVKGGSGCDDPGDVAEHPECR